jgi:ATP-dependent DNA ligase
MVAYKQSGTAQLVSRQGKAFTQRFPELAQAVAGLGADSVILDTEVAVFDRQLLQSLRVAPGAARGRCGHAADAHGFGPVGARWRGSPEATAARTPAGPSGLEAWNDVLRAGYEGLVAKDPATPYVGGGP